MIRVRVRPTRFVPFRKMPQLHRQPAGLYGVQATIIPFDVVVILLRLTVIANHFHASCHGFIVRGYRTRFTASTQILSRIEAERRRFAHGTYALPGILLSREVFRAM